MKFYLSTFLILVSVFVGKSQSETWNIPLKIKDATDFEFIRDGNGKACLLLDKGIMYYIFLLDSNYRILDEFKGRYFADSKPDFVGSIAEDGHFDLFFKRIETDNLLVLSIDAGSGKLERESSFKITTLPKERLLVTGSYHRGSEMVSISHAPGKLIHKVHLQGLKFKNTEFVLKPEDDTFVSDADFYQLFSNKDSLIISFKQSRGSYTSPVFRILSIDMKSGIYDAVDFSCDERGSKQSFSILFHDEVVLATNCYDNYTLHDRKTGNYLSGLPVPVHSIVLNDSLPLFRYSHIINNKAQYKYLLNDERRKIINAEHVVLDFIRNSEDVYLEVEFSIRPQKSTIYKIYYIL
nr:hypothetical protein [Bacteroidota bacterium]